MADQLCHALADDEYCRAVSAEIDRLSDIVRDVDATTPVPSCPGWTAAKLVAHTGMIHRWVDRLLRERAREPLEFTQFGRDLPTDWARYGDWLGAMAFRLPETLRGIDPNTPVWSFTDDRRAGFWPRRMLHETMVHRVDTELAAGRRPRVDTAAAVDGIDELLYLLSFGHPFRESPADLRGEGQTVYVHCPDVDVRWLIRMGPEGHAWEHLSAEPWDPPTATVRGNAAEVHLFLYNRLGRRAGRVERAGDPAVLADWLRRSAL
ncbi:TIGR03083 family protein [Amycolatopsis arida]|uniref:TIGR03083 family protein n=1 Tax=Amycolatopsis arida TaxID=587909 RepID=A0A1I5SSY5_9PSEU|nr:maleylpyruvate isomerase family mycothiol-dependent enzyme [Amycolatopsis arida]TDX96365.1 uncharacterized protein (TIGR03083 family) [Amycolatopsis arida]SFP73741.1 TIGR03083 family protein [Amycolatopsis arida]